MIPYELVRSSRKTLSLQITAEGKVLVRAPKRCSRTYIDEFVASKAGWIRSHQDKVRQMLDQRADFRLASGDELAFCGKQLRVLLAEGNSVRLDLERETITLPKAPVEVLRPGVEAVYRRAGLPWVQNRLAFWEKTMGISCRRVTLSGAVRRWGSCSAQGDIHISWILLFAPERAIDYVLVHELAHRVEFNHSPAFWNLVARYMPDYRQQKQVLKALQARLFAQGWSTKSQK